MGDKMNIKIKYLWTLILFLVLSTIGFIWLSLILSRPDAVLDINRECSWFRLYEDGSYVCRARNENYNINGCVPNGICQDWERQ